jgi:hydroxypyruvate isomerase
MGPEQRPGTTEGPWSVTLERVAALGERAGVTFCLENLNTAVDHPGVPFARYLRAGSRP